LSFSAPGLDSEAVATEREERLAKNEALFRAANERMADWEEAHAYDATELYFCECANRDCRKKVKLRKTDYERIRANSRLFFVVPGHELPDIERVVERNDEWSVIEKDANVAEVVAHYNPRSG
jgi:hypothetical protein